MLLNNNFSYNFEEGAGPSAFSCFATGSMICRQIPTNYYIREGVTQLFSYFIFKEYINNILFDSLTSTYNYYEIGCFFIILLNI